jgi:hypothetical protein
VGGDAQEIISIASVSFASPGSVRLTGTAVAGRGYQVQYRNGPPSGAWVDLGPPIIATGATASAEEAVGDAAQVYYRVVEP